MLHFGIYTRFGAKINYKKNLEIMAFHYPKIE